MTQEILFLCCKKFSAKVFGEMTVLVERLEQEFDKVDIYVEDEIIIYCESSHQQTIKCEAIEEIIDIINSDKGGNIFYKDGTETLRIDGYYKLIEKVLLTLGVNESLENLISQRNFDFKISNGTKETTLNVLVGEIGHYEAGISIRSLSHRERGSKETSILINPLKEKMRKLVDSDHWG